MVFHDRPVYQEEHAAQLIMARRVCSPHKGRIHLRRSVDRPFAFLLQSDGGPYIQELTISTVADHFTQLSVSITYSLCISVKVLFANSFPRELILNMMTSTSIQAIRL